MDYNTYEHVLHCTSKLLKMYFLKTCDFIDQMSEMFTYLAESLT